MLIVYDGVCNFCNGWVRFVSKRDHDRGFTFASAKPPIGWWGMQGAVLDPENPESIVLVDGNRYLQKSDAVLTILSRLGGCWPVASTLRILPKSFRDFCYAYFATRRYALFG